MPIQVVAWDFDGVLNRNIVDGRLIWADNFETDIGQSRAVFQECIFRRDLKAIMTGKEDLRDRVDDWARKVGYRDGPDALLAYWFAKDAHVDPEMLDMMDRLSAKGVRQVITTNNEARRAAYIEDEMGLGGRIEHMFASGRMGVAKPDQKYFEIVSNALGTQPCEIVLVDDSLKNVEAAKGLGWQGFHFTKETQSNLEQILFY